MSYSTVGGWDGTPPPNYTYSSYTVPITREVTEEAEGSSAFQRALNAQMESMKEDLVKSLYNESPLMAAVKKRKENNMSETEAAVRKARAEAAERKAAELLENIEGEIKAYRPEPGTFITARVEFPDNDKVYRYAWIKGDKHWYRTYSTQLYSTDDVVDELVRLVMDANSVEWEMVGVEQ